MLKQLSNIKQFTQSRQALLESTHDLTLIQLLNEIRDTIKENGDDAIINYTKQFDHVTLEPTEIKVTQDEIKNAYTHISDTHLTALKEAKDHIISFHQKQKPHNWTETSDDGLTTGLTYLPIEKAALYVPGGRNPYPSSVLMNTIPAVIAGVPHPIILTPPNQNKKIAPSILVSADLCGVTDIYKVGGAQAIFAAAYGTQTIPKVDKITGPGNRYVTAAKQAVYGRVDIDKPAGPSEVIVYCDDIQYTHYAAAELLAQMEHDPLASGILVCPHTDIANTVMTHMTEQLKTCQRHDIIKQACKQSGIIIEPDLDRAIDHLNTIASEHVVLLSTSHTHILKHLSHGASVFIGPYTPVALGDYFAGPNHVLPTNASARYASPLGVMDFMKYRSETTATSAYITKHGKTVSLLANEEGLDAHAKSIHIRLT